MNVTNSIGLVTGLPGPPAVANATEAVVVINSNNSATPLDASIVPSTVAIDARFPGPQYMRLLGTNLLEALEVQFPVPGAPNDDDDDLLGLGACEFFTETAPVDSGFTIGCFPSTTTLVIQNIRVNVSGLASPAQVAAIVSITGPTGASFTSNEVKIGLPLVGLITEVDGDPADGDSLVPLAGLLCVTDKRHPIITLTEGFATSFKTIGVPTFSPINTQVESGYFSPGSGVGKGGATQGTRFKIWFLNVPDGVTVSVPTGMNNSPDAAGLTPTETHDCTSPANWDGDAVCLSLISGADALGAGGFPIPFGDGMTDVAIDGDGMGMVVYEVKDANPFVTESCGLEVWFAWDVGAADPGTAQIVANFAPIATSVVADGVSPRPRFIDTGDSPADAFALRRCTTTLLFPWVTNQAQFDTGFAISNTSKDWLKTTHQSGVCRVHWHGVDIDGPTDAGDDTESPGTILAGDQFIFLASGARPGFQGYVIVVCEFQFAHGFAFFTDGFGSTPTLAQGYLALILEEHDEGGKRKAPEASDQ